MNRVEWAQSTEAIFAELLGRALAAGLWDGVEYLRPCDLGARLPIGFFRSVAEAAAVGRGDFLPRSASAGCDAPPGSRAKIAALAARADAGEELWHPGDASGWNERTTGIDHGDTEEEEVGITDLRVEDRQYQRPRKNVGRARKSQAGENHSGATAAKRRKARRVGETGK